MDKNIPLHDTGGMIIKSPLDKATKLSQSSSCLVYLKREDLQPVHSFKIRGAYNKISRLTADEMKSGVIAASAGNHAQGVALSAMRLGISAVIIMPQTTPSIKVEAVKGYGAEVVLEGDSYSDAFAHSQKLMAESGRVYVHPFDDPLVIAGQGTIGSEILHQLPDVTHIFVPIGGGGLIAGVASVVKQLKPVVKIIGVEPEDSNAMQASVAAGKRIELEHVGIFADGVAVKMVGEHTFAAVQKYVDESITVNTDQMCAAIKSIFEDTRSIVEPAGALGVAGLVKYAKTHDMKYAKAVAIASGANMTFERLQQIAERTLFGSGKEALYSVAIPEKAGALRAFCSSVVKGHSISEFSYRLNQQDSAKVTIGIGVTSQADKQRFETKMESKGYRYDDLSSNELAKEHIRHMGGGRVGLNIVEYFYQINFPERPGALANFLDHIGDGWSITLFHYRTSASDTGNVLIGFRCSDRSTLEKTLLETGYEFLEVDPEISTNYLK